MPIKARDIRAALKGKVDPDVSHVLEALAEEYSKQQQEILRLAQMLDETIDTIGNLAQVLQEFGTVPAIDNEMERRKAQRMIQKVRGADDNGLDS